MTYKPLLLKPEMALAIYEGRKIQHRFLMIPQPKEIIIKDNKTFIFRITASNEWLSLESIIHRYSPVGMVNDYLWVQTNWKTLPQWNHLPPTKLPTESKAHIYFEYEKEYHQWTQAKKRTAKYLPVAFAKIWLQVSEVHLAPIQSIHDLEAVAEGICCRYENGITLFQDYTRKRKNTLWTKDAIESFKSLWIKNNGQDNWHQNPWVWVIRFKRVNSPLSNI